MSTIRVLVADDHPVISQGLSNDLKAFGIREVASVSDGNEVIDRYKEFKPDVLVLDLRIGHVKGLEIARRLLASDRHAKVVVYSQFDANHIIREVYRVGAMAFVPKNAETRVLAEAIKAAYAGERYVPPNIAQMLATLAIEGDEPPQYKLTERELEVFKLLAEGQTHAEIAAHLEVNVKTVGLDFMAIKTKLGLSRLAEFTKLAIKYQLID